LFSLKNFITFPSIFFFTFSCVRDHISSETSELLLNLLHITLFLMLWSRTFFFLRKFVPREIWQIPIRRRGIITQTTIQTLKPIDSVPLQKTQDFWHG